MRTVFLFAAILCLWATPSFTQVPINVGIQILKAEDSRRYDAGIENLLKSPDAKIRERAAIAAGRIGDDKAVPALVVMLNNDRSVEVRTMAAFALGEIESAKASLPIAASMVLTDMPAAVRARLVEAAGKIVAANPRDANSDSLRAGIIEVLKSQGPANIGQDERTTLLALTAALRARPAGPATSPEVTAFVAQAEPVVAKFLDSSSSRIVMDAANTLARLAAKNSNDRLRRAAKADPDGAARANAIRALGAAVDKSSYDLFVAAMNDRDSRVRVAAIRSLASLREQKAMPKLIDQGRSYVKSMSGTAAKRPRLSPLISELLEIATALSRVVPNTENEEAIRFLNELRFNTDRMYGEVEIALARIAPKAYVAQVTPPGFGYRSPRQASAFAQGLGDIAQTKDAALIAQAGEKLTAWISGMGSGVRPVDQRRMMTAMPDMTTALAALKPNNLEDILLGQLKSEDVFIRAAAAGAIADQPKNVFYTEALKNASVRARLTDKHDNDAKMAILDALAKMDKKEAVGEHLMALSDQDYIVRKKAFAFLSDTYLHKDFPGIPTSLENARAKNQDKVLPYMPVFGTKLGSVLNTDIDYRRALSRKNGSVKALFTTEKGSFTIDFFPEEAPLTVDNFVKLARSGYFNGLEVHRVVPNFVMQDGDPRGDGNGGPGWSIRCEVNMREYGRGAVGMALSGKDTGGSQWFVTHSPQPHLDGGYTVFGQVNEAGMKVVDDIVRGDKILTVRIVGR